MLNHYEFRSKSTFTTSFLNTAIDICIIFISKDTCCIISHTYYFQHHQFGRRLRHLLVSIIYILLYKKHIASIIQRKYSIIFFLHRNGEANLSLPIWEKPDLRKHSKQMYRLYLKCKKWECSFLFSRFGRFQYHLPHYEFSIEMF